MQTNMPVGSIFVDTAGWGAYVDERESQHRAVVDILQNSARQGRRLVTTNYVLAELVALLSGHMHFPRARVLSAIDAIRASSLLDIVYISQTTDDEAWALLKARPDKAWSLVDAASFAVMRQHGMTEAITTDHHFDQAGFVRLPSE